MSDAGKAVFLSYASQDAEAAKKICDALRAAGVEVWFDQSELRGGDTWDAKIRKQIKECALFVPVISANTQARSEGYFRLEWKLAVDRSHLMADDSHFLFPVVIDDTPNGAARVPDKFREVQWTRLDVRDTPETLAVRVSRLLGGEGEQEPGDRRQPMGDRKGRGRKREPGWLRYVWIGFGLTMALVYALRPMWKPPHAGDGKPAPLPPAAGPVAPSAPLSEARQLAAKARALSQDKYDSTAEDFAAAETLVKRALELDPNDAEIWAVSSQLNYSFQSRGFDHSPSRVATAHSQAERALSLDPESLEALRALGRWQRDFEDPAVAQVTFEKILARQPEDASSLTSMAVIYDRQGRVDEAAAFYERAAAVPGSNVALTRYQEFLLYFHRKRLAEADRYIRQSVAIQPSANSQAMLAIMLLTWKGEADEAARVLASGPTAVRNEPRTIWTTALVQLCQRKPEDVLKTLDRFSDDYIQDNWFFGPKAYFTGRAHALAGRQEAARLAWESGLTVVDARLKTTPQSQGLHLMRGELLALLGQTDEARREARAVAELAPLRSNARTGTEQTPSSSRNLAWFASEACIYAYLGDADQAVPLLEKFLAVPVGEDVGWPLTPALLRLDPLWDKLRGDPRFQKLVEDAAPGAATAAPAPRPVLSDPQLRRAAQLLEGKDATAADIGVAEDLVKGVLAARPADVDATILMGRILSYILIRGFDRSEETFALARQYADRALSLAPDDPDAMANMAVYLYRRNVDLPRATKLLRQAIALRPGEPYYYRMLDNVLSNTPGVSDEEVIASARHTADLFPQDAVVQYELARHYRDAGMFEPALRYLDLAIKLGPLANAQISKAEIEFAVHGDNSSLKALHDSLEDRYRGSLRAVYAQFVYAMTSGQYDLGLEALHSLPEPWMIDFDYTGPTSLLAGEILLMQGKPEFARIKFEEAQAELRRHRPSLERNFSTIWLEAWILMRLGRAEEARARNALDFQELQRPFRIYLGTNWWFSPIASNLLLGERDKALALIREAVNFQYGRIVIRQVIKQDPRMAPWRDDKEIAALLVEPDVKK